MPIVHDTLADHRLLQLGGGCELALMCDIILASPTATFGQPEINIGVICGGGGTQRLVHAIGKSRTMELTLTGRHFSAKEAAEWGVVSRVVGEGEGQVVKEAVELASVIASKSAIAVQANKEAVNAAYEHTLQEGLRYERRLFHSLFATKDQKEGEWAYRGLGLLCCDSERALTDAICRYDCIRGEEEAQLVPLVRCFICNHQESASIVPYSLTSPEVLCLFS